MDEAETQPWAMEDVACPLVMSAGGVNQPAADDDHGDSGKWWLEADAPGASWRSFLGVPGAASGDRNKYQRKGSSSTTAASDRTTKEWGDFGSGEERGGDAADNFAEETYWDGQGDEDWAGTDECWADGAAWYDNAGTEVCSDWGPGHVNGETGEGSSSWDPETEWEGTPKPGPVKRSVSWSDDVGRPLKMPAHEDEPWDEEAWNEEAWDEVEVFDDANEDAPTVSHEDSEIGWPEVEETIRKIEDLWGDGWEDEPAEAAKDDDGLDDDLINKDLAEAFEAVEDKTRVLDRPDAIHPFPEKPGVSTKPVNPHAQRLLLASQQASDPKTDKKNAKAQPKGKCAPKGKAKAKTKAKAKAKNAKTPYAVAFESFKDQWWTSEERTAVLATIPIGEQKRCATWSSAGWYGSPSHVEIVFSENMVRSARLRYAFAKRIYFVIENPVTLVGNWPGLRRLKKVASILQTAPLNGGIVPDDKLVFSDSSEDSADSGLEGSGESGHAGGGKASRKGSKGKGAAKGVNGDESAGSTPMKGGGKEPATKGTTGKKGTSMEGTPRKGGGKDEAKGVGKNKGTSLEGSPAKGRGKDEATKGTGKKGTSSEGSPAKGGGKDAATKGAGKNKGTSLEGSPTKGGGKDEATKGAGKKGTNSEGSPTKGGGKDEAMKGTGKKGKSLEGSPVKGGGKDQPTKGSAGKKGNNESAEGTPGKGGGKDQAVKGSAEQKGIAKGGGKGESMEGTPGGGKKGAKGDGKAQATKGSTGKNGTSTEGTPAKGGGKDEAMKGSLGKKGSAGTPAKGGGKDQATKGSTGKKGTSMEGTPTKGGKDQSMKGAEQASRGKGATKELLERAHVEAAELSPGVEQDDWQSYLDFWQYNIHDMTHKPDDYVPADFENPLLIPPDYVLASLRHMQATQPRRCQLRLRKIREHGTMFSTFVRWQALHYPESKHSWGEAPAEQLLQHSRFLKDVLTGGCV
ncbi:unnamed protein product [Symbiodinium microadriaticum]|nr:unnamed protein product [Symbiodinium microadriaticum]